MWWVVVEGKEVRRAKHNCFPGLNRVQLFTARQCRHDLADP